jgi:hypothetical protein
LAARACGKSATYNAPAFFVGQYVLGRTGFSTHEENGPEREPKAPGSGAGDEFGLVEAAFALACAVEGDGDHDVGCACEGVAYCEGGELVAEVRGERIDTLKFQQDDGADDWASVGGVAADAGEAVGAGGAVEAGGW